MIVPSWDSIAATSTDHFAGTSSFTASSETSCLIRVARPNETGFVSARMSVNALMLPCRVCSSSTRSPVTRRCCSTAASKAARITEGGQGFVRNRKIVPG